MRKMRIEFGDDRDAAIKELERLGYVESPHNGGPYNPEDAEHNIIVTYESGHWLDTAMMLIHRVSFVQR